MGDIDPAAAAYLEQSGMRRLEIGAGRNGKPGWLCTDLNGQAGAGIIALDAARRFALPSGAFDYVYSEHMIEHLDFGEGRNMLQECHRVLKPGGVLRIVTPSLGFLVKLVAADRSNLEQRYLEWSVQSFVPEAPGPTNAFFLNNFVRAWGHKFIYDRQTLELAMTDAGFTRIGACEMNVSAHADLCGLENEGRLPPGFLALESMILEGTKAP